jgi:colanic acid/amylovoran biosynthesis glycosyltransferase
MYDRLVNHFSNWRIAPLTERAASSQPRRIGYYVWHFPAPSETFIQREIEALRRAGVDVQIFADAAEDVELLDAPARAFMQATDYLHLIDSRRLTNYQFQFFLKNPLRYLNLLLYTIFRHYGAYKNLSEDWQVFQAAVYLAGTLQEYKIEHVHSPWAYRSAFITLIAARLAQIPYSVQARASADLYRTSARYALAEKFDNAKFIITNSQFNAAFIRTNVSRDAQVPIRVIYEGLPLAQFKPQPKQTASAPIHILCVARLIEEKGLVYLLRALRRLREDGYTFRCDIVGAPVEPPSDNYYAALQELRRELQLQDMVTFVGALPFSQVLGKYACADMFVLPCVTAKSGGRDVTPNALLEAMAMQLSVISTRMSAIPEIVEHGVSGLLVPPKNERALAQAMAQLIDDATLRERLGQNARKRIEERFDIEKNIIEYVKLFEGETD